MYADIFATKEEDNQEEQEEIITTEENSTMKSLLKVAITQALNDNGII